MNKNARFEIRINKNKKEDWKNAAKKRGVDLTALIEAAVFKYLK